MLDSTILEGAVLVDESFNRVQKMDMTDHETSPSSPVTMELLAQAIVRVKKVFTYLPSADYLTGFQRWLKDRTTDWEKTALRIGLVGITSAGKSTFINALAGEDILPRGAQPTSGILVVCRRACERKLLVLFKNNSQEEYKGEDCNKIWVARYGDEKENPNNEQNVLEMQLYLPGLMIPDKYDLIDSPGLDAFGLQGHEELTLRTLIPLVDVVLFLTTTKSTSDRENLKALGKICKEAKPAIVVQTHRDAVEPRYTKGGKIVETKEEILEKHYQRVRQLLDQTMALQKAPIIQVSSIDALKGRTENPDVPAEHVPLWEESGFAQITEILEKLYHKLSQKIAERRMHLLLKEIQQVLERVKADYFSARGKVEEAETYMQAEFKRLQAIQESIPSEKTPNFPSPEETQLEIHKVEEFFVKTIESGDEHELENLSVQVRDRIKHIENDFFEKADRVDLKLQEIAEQLSIDLEEVRPDQQRHHTLPQLKRYEKLVKVEAIEQVGVAGKAKRIFGKLLNKEKWGYKEKEITQTCIDRNALRDDLQDYYSIYRIKLGTYLKRWAVHWVNGVAAILSAISQSRDDLNQKPIGVDPEPYRKLMGEIRTLRDWIEAQLTDNARRRFTLGFSAIKSSKKKAISSMTERTKNQLNLVVPLLHSARTIYFTRKTHRFWYVLRHVARPFQERPIVLVSTPFAQEILDYFGLIGDLSSAEEKDLLSKVLVYSATQTAEFSGCGLPVLCMDNFAQESRERWFLTKNTIVFFHDDLLAGEGGVDCFEALAHQADAIFRVVDFHQIGHDRKRLQELPVRNILESSRERMGYIAMGVARLMKSGQTVDAFKSYYSLARPPAFGLRPVLLGDGEDLLNSLFWLGSSLEGEGAVADEINAMEILNRTQGEFVKGRETFIRHLFAEIKEYKREQDWMEKHQFSTD